MMDNATQENLRAALANGDPDAVRALIQDGADIHYRTETGYDALINAVYGRDVLRDPRLLELLGLLRDTGVSLTGKSDYGETGIRVLARLGRFDGVQLLLEAGANPADLKMTPLMEAVIWGTVVDIKAARDKGADSEARDFWERTAFLLAVQIGSIPKAEFLLAQGADREARGRCGQPSLFYAISNGHVPMLQWLLALGADISQTDEFGSTALIDAVENDNLEAAEILLRAGADVRIQKRGTGILWSAESRAMILRLWAAGADPQDMTPEGQRRVLGLPPEPDAASLSISTDEWWEWRTRRFGTRNPERMDNPVWEDMIHSGLSAYRAAMQMTGNCDWKPGYEPTWCAQRSGQSLTLLPDGRAVQIAGEHEDHYDPDFCIYNDVFVHDGHGGIAIYGYPETVFAPTDFHTATLIGDFIYLVGSLGYSGTRRYGITSIYRLHIGDFHIETLSTTGDNPGWIYKHRADLVNIHTIAVSGGTVLTDEVGKKVSRDNADTWMLDVNTLTWTRA